jgi:hypothetical protein
MVPAEHVAWHAGNWYVSAHSVGVEHEGVAIQGAAWYNEQLYHSSARLVRYLAKRFNVPIDRNHIVGHDNIPGTTNTTQGAYCYTSTHCTNVPEQSASFVYLYTAPSFDASLIANPFVTAPGSRTNNWANKAVFNI